MKEEFKNNLEKIKARRAKKRKLAYKYIIDQMFYSGKYPTYQDIADYIEEETNDSCTKQNVGQIMKQLRERGYLVPMKYGGKQRVELPVDWIQRYDGS